MLNHIATLAGSSSKIKHFFDDLRLAGFSSGLALSDADYTIWYCWIASRGAVAVTDHSDRPSLFSFKWCGRLNRLDSFEFVLAPRLKRGA
jgi:hypothetical protein